MFIKLTRMDSTPIWLNAAFIVTVEPRKGGGAIVVPIGDGLDYEVREKPAAVLSMLSAVPAPEIVPVTVSDGLAPTPEDVSPEPELPHNEPPRNEPQSNGNQPRNDQPKEGGARRPRHRGGRGRKSQRQNDGKPQTPQDGKPQADGKPQDGKQPRPEGGAEANKA